MLLLLDGVLIGNLLPLGLHLPIARSSPGRRSCRLCALLRRAVLPGYSSKYSVVVSAAHTGAWVFCRVVYRVIEVALDT